MTKKDWKPKKMVYNALLTKDWPETDELADHIWEKHPECWNGFQIVYRYGNKNIYLTPYNEDFEDDEGNIHSLQHWKIDIMRA